MLLLPASVFTTRAVTTLAGGGNPGFADGTGSEASFSQPQGLVVDAGGIVFVADTGNNCVRSVTPGGLVRAIAGCGTGTFTDGVGADATFNNPMGVAIDASGNVFVTDSYNHRIRKLECPPGTFSTTGVANCTPCTAGAYSIAGAPSCTFSAASCPAGTYAAPPGSCLACAAGTFSAAAGAANVSACAPCTAGSFSPFPGATLCATCVAGRYSRAGSHGCLKCPAGTYGSSPGANFSSACAPCPPGSRSTSWGSTECVPCARGSGSAAGATHCATCDGMVCNVSALVDPVEIFVAGRGYGYVDGQGTVAQFNSPSGIATDANFNAYLAEGKRIRMVTPVGDVSTIAGSNGPSVLDGQGTSSSFANAYKISLGGAGLYILESSEPVYVRLLTLGTNAVTTLAVLDYSSSLSLSIAVDSSERVFLLVYGGEICILAGMTECVSFVGTGTPGDWPVDGWGTSAQLLAYPQALTFAADGSLFFSDNDVEGSKSFIRRVNSSGYTETLAGGFTTFNNYTSGYYFADGVGTAAILTGVIRAMAADDSGGMFFIDSNLIRHVTLGGAVSTLYGRPYSDAVGLASSFNTLWIMSSIAVSHLGGGICYFLQERLGSDTVSGYLDGSNGALFSGIQGISSDYATNNLYVADSGNYRVRMVTPEGIVSTFAGDGAARSLDGIGTAASFASPVAIAVSDQGTVLVCDESRIRAIAPATRTVTTLAGSRSGFADGEGTLALFDHPIALIARGRAVYVADTLNNRIRIVSIPSGAVTSLVGAGDCSDIVCSPSALWLSSGGLLYISVFAPGAGGHILAMYDTNNRSLTIVAGGGGLDTDGAGTSIGFTSPMHLAGNVATGTVYASDGAAVRTVSPSGFVRTLFGGKDRTLDPDFVPASRMHVYKIRSIAISQNSGFGELYFSEGDSIGLFLCGNTLCGAGSFCPSALRSSLCPAGRFGGNEGITSVSCSGICKSGTYCPKGSTEPTTCPVGSYCPLESADPTPCAPGFHSASPGRSYCEACVPGFLAPLPGAAFCDAFCPLGTFRKAYGGINASSCTPCPAGWYADTVGSAQCTTCDAGTASSLIGATSASSCAACPAGTAAPAGSPTCAPCYAGSWSSARSSTCAECPLGTFSPLLGATSPLNCTPCAMGTTLAPGAALATQCIAVPITCPAGTQPASPAAPLSSMDCVPLACPPPLRFETGTAASSHFCVGCGAGTRGAPGNCTPCTAGEVCPGLGSSPLFSFYTLLRPFSAAPPGSTGAARRALAASGPAAAVVAACPPARILPILPPPPPSSQLVLYAALLAGAVLLATVTVYALRMLHSNPASLEALKKIDMFEDQHKFEDGVPVIRYHTALGGMFSIWAATVIVAYAAFMVQQYLTQNVLVQQSLAVFDDEATLSLPPWAAAPPPWAPNAPAAISGLQIRLLISGEPGACAEPLSWSAAGQDAGGWALTSTASCGGAPVSQHVFSCTACALDAKSAVTASFHYSCQSLLLEALSAPAHPAGNTSARGAPLLKTVAPSGGRLAAVAWTLGVSLTTLQDDTKVPPLSAAGYLLSWQELEVTRASWGAQAGSALLLAQPAAAALQLTVALPLQPNVVVRLRASVPSRAFARARASHAHIGTFSLARDFLTLATLSMPPTPLCRSRS